LRRELKVPETGEREAIQASDIHTLPAHLQATKGILGGQRFSLFRLDWLFVVGDSVCGAFWGGVTDLAVMFVRLGT